MHIFYILYEQCTYIQPGKASLGMVFIQDKFGRHDGFFWKIFNKMFLKRKDHEIGLKRLYLKSQYINLWRQKIFLLSKQPLAKHHLFRLIVSVFKFNSTWTIPTRIAHITPFGIFWTTKYEWSLGAFLPSLVSEWRNKLSSDRQRGPRWRWCNKHTRVKACEMEPSMIVRISSCWPNKTLHVFQILMTKHNAQCSIVFGDQSKFWMFCSSI